MQTRPVREEQASMDAVGRLLIVDRHAVVRAGIRAIVADDPGLTVVAEVATAAAAVTAVHTTAPNVAITGVELPDGSGIDLVRHLRRTAVDVRCIALHGVPDDQTFFHAVVAGAVGYLTDDIDAPDLLAAIHKVVAGHSLVDKEAIDDLRRRARRLPVHDGLPSGLTGQERRILRMVVEGSTNGEIAASLGLAEKTVRNYMSTILTKTGARNRTELTAHVVRWATSHPTTV